MAEGYHNWFAGEEVTAANLEDYCQLQSVMRFTSAAARNSALSGVLTEGLMAYLKDVNTLTVYTGSAWSTIGPVHGAMLTWTPVVVQGATPTLTVNRAVYQRVGRNVWFEALVTMTSSGTAANDVTITLPVQAATAYASFSIQFGTGFINDTSATSLYPAFLSSAASATTVKLRTASSSVAPSAYLGSNSFTAALASGDNVMVAGTYEAAADA